MGRTASPPALTLYPEAVEQVRQSGPNALTEPERQKLVLSVVPWCRKLARQHATRLRGTGRHVETEELEGEAFLAATEAAQYWDERRGVQFVTFCTAWVTTHLKGVTDPRLAEWAVGMEFPEQVRDRDEGDDEPVVLEPTPEEKRYLSNLAEPARTIVRLFIFEELDPSRIAEQLDMPLKDVRLILRNAADKLTRAKATGDAADRMIASSGNEGE